MAVETKGLAKWVDRLSNLDMPVLAGVIQDLNRLSESEEVSAEQIARAISKDAGLTTQVLRIASSVHYSGVGAPEINTIHRAVTQLGFSGIRAICISLMVVDSIVGPKPKHEMLNSMAKSFHAAVQARNLGAAISPESQEDCFVAALLFHIGEVAFLSRGGKQAEHYHKLMEEHQYTSEEAASHILGTDFRSISLGLAQRWDLSPVLINALEGKGLDDRRVQAVLHGEAISQTAVFGWDSPEFGETLARISEQTGKSMRDLKDAIIRSAMDAAVVVGSYGLPEAAKLIPNSAHVMQAQTPSNVMKPDAQLQLDILRKLGSMILENTDMNSIFRLVIEGLHKGVGFERVVLCLVNPKTGVLQAKYVQGEGTEKWAECSYECHRADDNILASSLLNRETLFIKSKKDPRYRHLMTLDCMKQLGSGAFIIAPLHAGPRNIGVFIVDRSNTGEDIKGPQFESFKYFVQQTNAALSRLAAMAGNQRNNKVH